MVLSRRVPLFLFYVYLLLTVSACSYDGQDINVNNRVAPPPSAAEQAKPLETIAPIPSAMDTFRALAPPEGLKFTPLFAEPVKDATERARRLEDAVQLLRNDFDTVMPTVVRLAAIEKDIKGLVTQLQTLTDQGQNGGQGGAAAPASPAMPSVKVPPVTTGAIHNKIPGEEVAKGTEPATAAEARAAPAAASSLVTPEAASKGVLPPEGAASPSSRPPMDLASPAAQPFAPAETGALKIPGDEIAKGTEPAVAATAPAGPDASSSLVTPEAASKGALPPEGAASPSSTAAVIGDVTDIRIADRADNTRVVLEMTLHDARATSFGTVDLQNKGRTLVIDLSQMNWLGKKSWEADIAKLISGYRVAKGHLYVEMLHAAQIGEQSVLPPTATDPHYRLVIDLARAGAHR